MAGQCCLPYGLSPPSTLGTLGLVAVGLSRACLHLMGSRSTKKHALTILDSRSPISVLGPKEIQSHALEKVTHADLFHTLSSCRIQEVWFPRILCQGGHVSLEELACFLPGMWHCQAECKAQLEWIGLSCFWALPIHMISSPTYSKYSLHIRSGLYPERHGV